MPLTLSEANQVVHAAVTKAQEMNIRISVAVCDAGGRPVAFNRMDGAIWASAYGSPGKAVASVAFGRARGELQERPGGPVIPGLPPAQGGPPDPRRGAGPGTRTPIS